MSRHRHLAEIRQLEQQLLNAINEMENQYPDDPYRRLDQLQEKEIERLKAEIAQLVARKMRPKLVFNLLINNKNYNSMAIITSLNLTSTAPVQLFMSVVDQNSNVIAGVLTLQSVTPADPTQDISVLDPTTPDDVDIHAVALQGGTGVVAVGTFVSTALNPDGTPVLTGTFTSDSLAVTNNIVIATPPTGKLVFNQ
jgi:hypothetical protein